ncbi:MAG: tetratricopeptide repeat protein [Armatimonadota bacterium]|nr:tetratricopeptide repeat protein [bacterium]MCS7309540.1 tetratricopeptide repeat protein [Armatimonadota bacterium]MDW8105355.1 tetratricopeptide repeat protein [Armatimonadota bacterium]MDW8291232.1 tetratricopeptide repeat protein [Armatimonadota bacterium]
MQDATRRALILAVCGAVVIAVVLGLRQMGFFRSAQARANEEFRLSDLAHHNNDPEAAIRHMQNAVKLDPHFVEAREGLAALYDQHRGMEHAVAEYERAIREDPQNEARYCYRIAQLYFLYRQWQPALEWARRAQKLQPDDHHVQRIIGFCLERQNKWQEAEQHWNSLLQKDPGNTDVQRSLERVRRHLAKVKPHNAKGG